MSTWIGLDGSTCSDDTGIRLLTTLRDAYLEGLAGVWTGVESSIDTTSSNINGSGSTGLLRTSVSVGNEELTSLKP